MHEDRRGEIVADRYEIADYLDKGGMGVLYTATHLSTRRPVVLKFLLPGVSGSKNAVRRFFHEARAAAALNHRNVIEVLDLGHDANGQPFMALEKLEGESLYARLEREPKLSPTAVLDIALPVLDALSVAHAHQLIHRDIKPSNIFLSVQPRGFVEPKLLDFGAVKLLDNATASVPVTMPGAFVGTAAYMPPELLTGEGEPTPGQDIWSMGVMIYRCLAGRRPFEARSPSQLVLKIAIEDPPPLLDIAPDVPSAFGEVIVETMRRDPAQRMQSAQELTAALVGAAEASGVRISSAARMAAEATLGFT